MADPIYSREDLRRLVQLSSLINSSLDTQEALNNALMSVTGFESANLREKN